MISWKTAIERKRQEEAVPRIVHGEWRTQGGVAYYWGRREPDGQKRLMTDGDSMAAGLRQKETDHPHRILRNILPQAAT